MKLSHGTRLVGLVVLLAGLALRPAGADPIVLDFEGIGDLAQVLGYYGGGLDSSGNGPGTNYGITFGSDALALIDSDVGGSGNTGLEPSPETVLFFLSGTAAVMNVPAGFDTGFSFFYSSVSFDGDVTVYDGLDGTGNVLAALPLTALGEGPGDPNGAYSNWAPVGVGFAGTAKSVAFGGVANQIVFDDVTLGSASPGTPEVPEPGALASLAAMAVAGFGFLRRRR